jgi:hypothetical protein
MASSSKTSEFQAKFTQDDSKSFFQVVHKRGQRVTKHMREFVPTVQTGNSVDGSFVEFKLQKIGHMVDSMTLTFDFVLKREDINAILPVIATYPTFDALTYVPYTAIHAVEDVRVTYGGDTIELIDSDEARLVNHLFQSRDEKLRTLHGTTGASAGWVSKGPVGTTYSRVIVWDLHQFEESYAASTFGCPTVAPCRPNDQDALHSSTRPITMGLPFPQIGSLTTKDFVASLRYEIPWSHAMSADKNLPIAFLDAEPVVHIRFRKSSQLVRSVGGYSLLTQDLVSKGKFLNPRLVVEYRDQPGSLLSALAKTPSITYPMSQIIRERIVLDAGVKPSHVHQLKSMRGLVHSIAFMIRRSQQVDGGRGNTAPLFPSFISIGQSFSNRTVDAFWRSSTTGPFVYDYDALDFTNWTGNEGIGVPYSRPFQRQLQSWYMTSNGERITGKIDIDASYCLNEYKKKYFPGEAELEQAFMGADPISKGNLPGYNLYAYTFGLDGSRDAVGTGNMNFDALQNVLLHLNFRTDIVLGTGVYYVDVFGLTANFTTIAGGNWFRQLPA